MIVSILQRKKGFRFAVESLVSGHCVIMIIPTKCIGAHPVCFFEKLGQVFKAIAFL